MLQRQGQLEPDGSPSTRRAQAQQPRTRPQPQVVRESIGSRILEFLREVLPETRIQRVEHKVAGAYVCGYELGPLPPGHPSTPGDPAVAVCLPQD